MQIRPCCCSFPLPEARQPHSLCGTPVHKERPRRCAPTPSCAGTFTMIRGIAYSKRASKHWTNLVLAARTSLFGAQRTQNRSPQVRRYPSTAAMLTIPIVASTALPTRSFEASRRAATNPWKPIDFCAYSLARRCSEKAALLFSHPGRDL